MGSGREILDGLVDEELLSLNEAVDKASKRGRTLKIPLPYMLCLVLTAKAQSIEKTVLDRYGVGGVFNCIL